MTGNEWAQWAQWSQLALWANGPIQWQSMAMNGPIDWNWMGINGNEWTNPVAMNGNEWQWMAMNGPIHWQWLAMNGPNGHSVAMNGPIGPVSPVGSMDTMGPHWMEMNGNEWAHSLAMNVVQWQWFLKFRWKIDFAKNCRIFDLKSIFPIISSSESSCSHFPIWKTPKYKNWKTCYVHP